MPCHAMPCHAMPCHTIPYHTILYYTYVILCYIIRYDTIRYYTILYYTIKNKTVVCLFVCCCYYYYYYYYYYIRGWVHSSVQSSHIQLFHEFRVLFCQNSFDISKKSFGTHRSHSWTICLWFCKSANVIIQFMQFLACWQGQNLRRWERPRLSTSERGKICSFSVPARIMFASERVSIYIYTYISVPCILCPCVRLCRMTAHVCRSVG